MSGEEKSLFTKNPNPPSSASTSAGGTGDRTLQHIFRLSEHLGGSTARSTEHGDLVKSGAA